MTEIEKDRPFYDNSGGGVTFSGGEPLLQKDFLLAALKACVEAGLHTVVETAGNVPFESLLAVVPYTSLFLYDLKVMDDATTRRATGTGTRAFWTISGNLPKPAYRFGSGYRSSRV